MTRTDQALKEYYIAALAVCNADTRAERAESEARLAAAKAELAAAYEDETDGQ